MASTRDSVRGQRIGIVGLIAFATVAHADSIPGSERLEAAAAYSHRYNGHSMLVLHDGKIFHESYANGGAADKPHRLASGAKSFCGVLAAAAVLDELLTIDEYASDTLTEWKDDARKSGITIRHLLTLTSGLDAGAIGRVPTYTEAVRAPAHHDPGTVFAYGPAPFQIFGEILRRKLEPRGETVDAYLKRRILDPLGIQPGFWRKHGGQIVLPSGVALTSRDWAAFGEFVRLGGVWNGESLVDADTLAACFVGTDANAIYGMTFWLIGRARDGAETLAIDDPQPMPVSGTVPVDTVMAAGAGKQRLYIVPSRKLIIVRQGESPRFNDAHFLSHVFGSAE